MRRIGMPRTSPAGMCGKEDSTRARWTKRICGSGGWQAGSEALAVVFDLGGAAPFGVKVFSPMTSFTDCPGTSFTLRRASRAGGEGDAVEDYGCS